MLATLKRLTPFIFIFVLAFLIRLPFLNGSVWLDEAAQILESERPFSQQHQITADFQPPLLHYLLHFSLYLSTAPEWLRFITALIPGLISIWGTYIIANILYSKKVAFFSALLLSLSSLHVFYSQELRPYMLPTLFAVLSWLQLVRVTQTDAKKKPVKPFFRFTICTILGLYSSYLYPFLFLSQVVFLLIHSKRWLPYIFTSIALCVLAYLPWLPSFFGQLNAGGIVRQELPGWSEVVSIPQLKALPLVFLKFIYGVLDVEPTIFFMGTTVLVGLLLSGHVFYNYRLDIKRFFKENTLTISWLFIPLLTAWLVSFFIPVVQPKRVLFLLPAFFILIVGQTLTNTSRTNTLKNIAATLTISVLIAIQSFSLYSYWTNPKLQREDWRSLQQQVSANFPLGQTVLVFSFPGPFASWEYYDRHQYATFSTGTLLVNNAPNLQERLRSLDKYRYILVFDYLRDLTDPQDILLQEIKAFGYQEVQVIDYPNIGFVRVYAKPETVLSSRFTF